MMHIAAHLNNNPLHENKSMSETIVYTSQIAWPHLWAALMCLPNSSCLLSSCPCVSGD